MKNRLFSKQTPIMVGIDMGAHSVKAVLLSRHNDVYKVDAIVVESMLKSVMADREIRDIKAMANVLSKIRKKIPRSVKFAATAVSGSTVISKIILMDVSLTDAELESQIEVEADTLIPYPLTEVSLDFEKLDVNEADPSKVNVLLSAARTESIEARVAALEQSGFTAKVVDIESYALSRAAQLCLKQLPDDAYEKVVAMIDIGATMTLLSIVQNGKTLYTRDQIFGGDQYTRSILSYYNKSYEEAEQAKINGDLPSDYTFERRGIQMYLTSSGKDRVDYLVLSGGTALITGMAQLISEELGIHTVLANPFNAMEVATAVSPAQLHCHASQLMVACGLALRSFSSWHI
jgi:type IV pilus assembly protein PilM